jgi:zinc/manganese transport system substrate-binding protein
VAGRRRLGPLPRLVAAGLATALAGLVLAGCAVAAADGPGRRGDGRIQVVAAENMWGSVAAQVGGDRVDVASIIDSPDADPHDYEPTAADGRTIAVADVLLSNGIGYDTWAAKLAAANPSSRVDLTVGDIVGVAEGGNPHRWYDPADVDKVAARLADTYARLDPTHAGYFAARLASFEGPATAGYHDLVREIRTRFGGTPVGASESIFALLAPSLGLDLVTPPSFLRAISEGSGPTADDKATVDEQIAHHEIAVYVENVQNATPDIQVQVSEATAAGIPVATITETMVPATASWQQWQSRQLAELRDALAKATGR